ncbi:hypothetical protein GYMLUDRAFT_41600 [Collybiopsis luxurians FD-317 M1]|uniref:DUF6534 domain-containing protein n=1 Tax=Collybiopsis luxurians FD-317 M1 TaxID=944289 RepID=A0A0D0D0W4_9AGAR|nr:hypothetical protein GYMLUDRAFT_41600 [Collybiopsis luxurians FD-317 M1]
MADGPDPKLVLGPFLLGVMLNIGMEGALIVQFWHYWETFRTDKTWIRLFVLYLFILETFNTGFGIAIVWEPLMSQYATPAALTFFPTYLPAQPFVTSLISTPMQIFVAWRIYVNTRSIWMPLAISVCAIGSIAGAYWTGVTVILVKTYLRKVEINHPGIVWSSFTTAADCFMTMALTFIMLRNRRKSPHSVHSTTRAIQVTIQTGVLTAIFAILDVVLFVTQTENTINFVWDFGLSKLYTNILIATFNARPAPYNSNLVQNIHNALFGDDVSYSITKASVRALETGSADGSGTTQSVESKHPEVEHIQAV